MLDDVVILTQFQILQFSFNLVQYIDRKMRYRMCVCLWINNKANVNQTLQFGIYRAKLIPFFSINQQIGFEYQIIEHYNQIPIYY